MLIKEKLKVILQILLNSPETNLVNYTSEQIDELNAAVNEACYLLENLIEE